MVLSREVRQSGPSFLNRTLQEHSGSKKKKEKEKISIENMSSKAASSCAGGVAERR